MFSGISFAVGILLAGGRGGLGNGQCGELCLWSSSVGSSNAVGRCFGCVRGRGLSAGAPRLPGFMILGVVYDCHL